MRRLTETILRKTNELPEGGPVSAKMLLRFGSRPAVDQSLAARSEWQTAAGRTRHEYVPGQEPVWDSCSLRTPSGRRVFHPAWLNRCAIRCHVRQCVGTHHPSTDADDLQVPTQTIYWTSGRKRKLNLGKLVIQPEHVPSWQLAFAKEPAGEIVRALAWAGPERVQSVLAQIDGKVPKSELQKVAQQVSRLPGWVASALSRSFVNA